MRKGDAIINCQLSSRNHDHVFRYALSHVDFHFGSVNSQGSEHSIDGAHSPMEMEVVFYDGAFKSPTEVQFSENKDAIVTISFLFEVNMPVK